MSRKFSLLGLLYLGIVFVGSIDHASADTLSIVGGPIYDSYSNSNLYIVSKSDWASAETFAESMGGHLMTIHSAEENQFVLTNVLTNLTSTGGPNLSSVPVWIGLHDPVTGDGSGSTHANNFVWADGSTSSYRNWNSGEPNNANNAEYYAAINWQYSVSSSNTAGTWNDTPLAGSTGYGGTSNGTYYGIMAAPVPEPGSLALLGLGFAGMTGFRFVRRARSTK